MNEQAIFRAIADPTRRAIIGMLAQHPLSVGQVADHFDMTRPAIAKHLRILQDGDIITVKASGRERINILRPHSLKTLEDWLSHYSHFWDEKLHKLKSAIEPPQHSETKP